MKMTCVTVDVHHFLTWDNYGHTMNQIIFPIFHAMRETNTTCAWLWGLPSLLESSPGRVALNHVPGLSNVSTCERPCWRPIPPKMVLECDSLFHELKYQQFSQDSCTKSMHFMRSLTTTSKTVLYHSRTKSHRHRTLNHQHIVDMINKVVNKRYAWSVVVYDADQPNQTAEQQRQLFARSDIAVIPHGAGMANIPFMKPGTTAIIDSCQRGGFWGNFITDVNIVPVCRHLRSDDADDIWNTRGVYLDVVGLRVALNKAMEVSF